MKLLNKVRKFFYLTPRDIGAQIYTVEEIAEKMKPVEVDPHSLPLGFADTIATLLD